MAWLLIPLTIMALDWYAIAKGRRNWGGLSGPGAMLALLAWLWVAADLPGLGSGEAGLLRWFGWGLAFSLAGEVALVLREERAPLAIYAFGAAAVSYALGLDALRPDAYAYWPAGILAALVLLLGWRVMRRLAPALNEGGQRDFKWPVALAIAGASLLLYAAFYKFIDRVWTLPWNYLVPAGALLLYLSGLWWAWGRLLSPESGVQLRVRVAYHLGQLLLVASAYAHYGLFF